MQEAMEAGDSSVVITIVNELIGFYRDTTQKDKALKLCAELIELLGTLKLEGSIPYATSLLNIANAFRAFGLHKEAVQLFEKVEEIRDYIINEIKRHFKRVQIRIIRCG